MAKGLKLAEATVVLWRAAQDVMFHDLELDGITFRDRCQNVLTDALPAYKEGVKTVFAEQAKHIHKCGIKKPHGNNNRIERLNGTLRERVKVQRGWKKYQTALAEGKRIQYNFVKPHMALEGMTPANAAGIEIKGWRELLAKGLAK